jgi:hypothetical protein
MAERLELLIPERRIRARIIAAKGWASSSC